MIYSVDTSILIHIFDHYSETHHPEIMEIFFDNLEKGNFLISDIVMDEFRNEEAKKNILDKNPKSLVPSISEIQKLQKKIVSKYPLIIDPTSTRNNADPFVIAVAQFYNISVLTNETIKRREIENINKIPNQHIRKIPHICLKEGITCHSLVLFLASLFK